MDLIIVICAAIVAILVGKAIYAVRTERGAQRGTDPGDGETEIIVDYASGVGGGQHYTYKISKDPQKYAQAFVPKKRTKK